MIGKAGVRIPCPKCSMGKIGEHEVAQKHDRCGDCRIKQSRELSNASVLHANNRVRSFG